HIYIWEYYIWNWRGWSTRPKLAGYPVFFPHILQADIRFQRDHNVRGEKTENEAWSKQNRGLNHLIVYLTGRLLYAPDLDVDNLLDDYYTTFFGDAHDEMKAFWEHAERCWMRDTSSLHPKNQAAEIIRTLYSPDDLRLFFDLLAAARAKVELGSKEAARIALIEHEMAPLKARLSTARRLLGVFGDWTFRPDPDDRGMPERWYDVARQAGPDWRAIDVPAFLPKSDAEPFLGYGWYATTFTVPKEHRGRPIELFFEAVDEQAWVFVNGKPIGEHSIASTGRTIGQLWEEPFVVKAPVRLLAADGRNRLAVRLHNSKSGAGIWRPVYMRVVGADQPPLPQFTSSAVFPPPPIDGTYHSEWGGAAVDLVRARVKIAHDPQSLYLTFEAKEDGTAPLPSELDGRDWFWAGRDRWYLPRGASNSIMLEIQPDPSNATRHFSLLVNVSGQCLDAFYGDLDLTNPRDWKSDVRAATTVNEDGWTGTVAIPWKSLGLRLRAGTQIRANISHWRAGKATTYWSPLPAGWDHAQRRDCSRERFGIISFLEQ
ncbi:MAG: DUF4838 domain-containing protein, partial [Lentisphaerae bacterium]|nr:DUF4838 domain-containing protein [Lentisphaerota bacterium]